jgi:hypothetical protein
MTNEQPRRLDATVADGDFLLMFAGPPPIAARTVLPPNSIVAGHKIGYWTGRWWNWA